MRYLYYCNSTYQLLTITNLHWHRKFANFEHIEDYHGDVIVLNSFSGAEEVTEVLKSIQIFDDVRLINKAYNTGRFHTLHTIMDVLCPLHYLESKHGIQKNDIYGRYDVISVPKYSTIVGAIWRVNSRAKLHLIEDGLATYYLNPDLLRPHSKLYKLIYKFKFAKDFTNFDSLYLNVPDLYTGEWHKSVIGIPGFDDMFLKELQNCFAEFSQIKNEDGKDIYWLSQTLENDKTRQTIKEVLDSLKEYKDRVLYCPHPRWPEKEKQFYDMAPEKQVWEMKLLNMKDVDNKLFISIHSTACLTPKMLFNREPYLILFYPMIDKKVIEGNERFERTIDLFVNQYKVKDKIMFPKTKEEFVSCVRKYVDSVH